MSTEPFSFLAETHTAVAVGMGDRVFKLRKPVDLGFIDQRTLEQRRTACGREVELNRRFAPDVYLGVGTLSSPDGPEAEPVVVMRRLPADRRLAHLARTGADLSDAIRQIAHLVAGYHAVAPRSTTANEAASAETTRRRWETNAGEMTRWVGTILDEPTFERVASAADRYLRGRERLFDERVEQGWARDGHGDLLAEDIFWLEDGPRILDCLDFDEHLRVGDVLADAAFLAMDLERLGRPELGWSFLRTHAALLDDHWPDSLAHHHIAYRAQVRAKVSCIRADQGDPQAAGLAQRLFGMVERHLTEATVRLVLVGGPPGAGKSTLSAALADRLDAVVLTADRVRKELAGLSASERADTALDRGIYDHEHTVATYTELIDRARALLTRGTSVVLDAGWRDPAQRDQASTAAEDTDSVLSQLRCDLPEDVALDRIERRLAVGDDASDVDLDVARALRRRTGPWPEARPIDTAQSERRAVEQALRLVLADR